MLKVDQSSILLRNARKFADMDASIGDRIKKARTQRRLTQSQLAQMVGVSAAAVSQWESGNTRGLRPHNLLATAHALALDVRWLVYGRASHRGMHVKASREAYVPVISWVQAGAWTDVDEAAAPPDALDEWLPCPAPHGPRTFALRVRGESMYNPHGRPSFQDGDLIFVDPDRSAEHRSLVIVRLHDSNEATFKQLVIDGQHSYLKALNPGWPTPMIEVNHTASVCGVVIFKGEQL